MFEGGTDMITNLGTVAVYVEDRQKAKEFWTQKVGFSVVAAPNGSKRILD